MWIYNCPLGKMEIKFDHNVKKYALWLGDECGGYYPSAEAAADDVYTQTSGIDAIDYLKESRSGILPHDLGGLGQGAGLIIRHTDCVPQSCIAFSRTTQLSPAV